MCDHEFRALVESWLTLPTAPALKTGHQVATYYYLCAVHVDWVFTSFSTRPLN